MICNLYISSEATFIKMANDETESIYMYQMFLLLYVDDTVICSESENDLEESYCAKWYLLM